MKIIKTNFEGNNYYFCQFHPNDYTLKLVNVPKGSTRKSVETFCNENKGELAINGGLFDYSILNNKAKYIDGIYNSYGSLVNDGGPDKPAIVFSKDGEMWSDVFEAANGKDKNKYSWVRSVAYYGLVNDGNIGCFSTVPVATDTTKIGEEPSKYKEKHKRTMIGQKYDKTIIIACSEGEVTGYQQSRFMKQRGCKWAFNLDGGGSSHMYDGVNKKYIVKGDRTVTDALVVVKKIKLENNPETTSNFTMRLHSGETPILDREISGEARMVVPQRGKIDIIGLYGWPDSNGYRWAWGKRYTTEGAFKYDPRIMIIEGKPIGNYRMKLTGSAARLRESVVNGRIKTTVQNGSEIKIIEFLKSVQSDGYQWCYGVYNGVYGYFQYDTAVMYPTND